MLAVAGVVFAAQAAAQATFYEHEGFAGRTLTAREQVPAFERYGFNDRASSVVVVGDRWEVCQDVGFNGPCVVLRQGRYPSLAAMGLNDRVSSARIVSRNARIDDDRYVPVPVAAQVTFYEREGFDGGSFTTADQVVNLRRTGFNERASSAVVVGDRYEVCDDNRFRGRCVVLRPGRYASLAAMGLNDRISSVRAVASNARIGDDRYAPAPLTGQVTFYEREGFDGRSFTTEEQIANLQRSGFNDRASSAVVLGVQYEVCDDAGFRGRCVVLRPGRYPSLAAMGLNDRVLSVRAVAANARIGDDRYAPAPVPVYDSRRRGGERLYEANVTSARAVLATSGQRCWVEREQVVQERGKANVPGAIVGAIIGGILGHQVGGGTGKDIATVGGVVGGAAVGANVGRNGGQATTQDVQRCENVPGGAQPAYWDVTYNFRGQDHRVQMATAPGTTITVNEQGEPRQ
ncbi:MAG: beta/gamma crystallin-related protein [Rubrivivax sp.]|nr:beta/gamma crystallin-related protein [Rubrivivax sp.]